MWPMLLDMTKLECKKDLRKLGTTFKNNFKSRIRDVNSTFIKK